MTALSSGACKWVVVLGKGRPEHKHRPWIQFDSRSDAKETLNQEGKRRWYKQMAHADELSSGQRFAEKLNRPDFDTPVSGAIQTMVKAVRKESHGRSRKSAPSGYN